MYYPTKSRLWKVTTYLLLFVLLFAPAAGFSSRAAPDIQEEIEPQFIAADGDHLVTNVSLTPDSPNILALNQRVDLTFSYNTIEANGVRIFILPFTNGSPTPFFAVSGSPLYPQSATGQGSAYLTVTSGTVVVDQIRIRMTTGDQSTLLFETFIPVHYLFSDSPNIVTNISMGPDTPDVLNFDQDVNFDFNYSNNQRLGVRIFIRPVTNGNLTPNYAAHGSGVYQFGSGGGAGYFTITSGQVVVDQIRVRMVAANQSTVLFEAFLPVYYRFMGQTNRVTNIEFNPDTPNIFQYDENFNLSFNYNHNQRGGVRIWARPFSGSNLAPNYAAHGSPLYTSTSGTGTGSFRLSAGPLVVDKVRIQMWNSSETTLLYEAFLPVHLFWAGAGPPPGPDMRITGLEVTQAIQDLNNSVELVAGKKTYVRMHVDAPVNVSDVYATLSGRRGFITLNPILAPGNPGSTITVRTSPDRGQINHSFWFELPSSWTNAGSLTLTARLDPNNVKNDLDQTDNVRSVAVNFLNSPPLRLRLVNVRYTAGGSTYQAANSHLDALESWLRRAYPIPYLQVSRQTFTYPSGFPNVDTLHSYLALAKLLRMIFSGEDSRTVYYGIVDDGYDFMRGKAAGIPGTVAAGPTGTGNWGWDYDGSYGDWYGGHEIGHTRGRYHAEFCGAGGGAPYPYPNGRISPDLTGNGAIYGFDITTHAIYEPNWKDVMTYCDYEWMSDFTYEGIRSYLAGLELQTSAPEEVTADEFLAVVGMADLDSNTAELTSVYMVDQTNTLPLPEPGDWTIALVGAGNTDLATFPFAPDELTDAEESAGRPAVIAEVVPWSPGTTRVEIRYNGGVVASRNASANAPTVTLNTPAEGSTLAPGQFQVSWTGNDLDGDDLTYSLMYSNDNGVNWVTLASELTGNSHLLNTNQLPGGTGLLKVVVSDGFLSDQDTNGNLTVPLHAPSAQILAPSTGQYFAPTQEVYFQGAGYDLEDETLADEAFAWSSSIDGPLGTGASLSSSILTTGTHVITLTVTDSDTMSTEVQTTINISLEGPPTLYLPLLGK